MSYILDALRKSEQERQMATGHSLLVSSSVVLKRTQKLWVIPMFLAVASFAGLAIIWLVWSLPIVNQTVSSIYRQIFTDTSQTQTMPTEILPEYVVKEIDLTRGNSKNSNHEPTHSQTHSKALGQATVRDPASAPAHAPSIAKTLPQSNVVLDKKIVTSTQMRTDPLQGLPALNISGYVHDEQGSSIAMINNQLVHEGEEISPGLRLVKILDDSAIFSYKGYVFSR